MPLLVRALRVVRVVAASAAVYTRLHVPEPALLDPERRMRSRVPPRHGCSSCSPGGHWSAPQRQCHLKVPAHAGATPYAMSRMANEQQARTNGSGGRRVAGEDPPQSTAAAPMGSRPQPCVLAPSERTCARGERLGFPYPRQTGNPGRSRSVWGRADRGAWRRIPLPSPSWRTGRRWRGTRRGGDGRGGSPVGG